MNPKAFITEFLHRKGLSVFLASLVEKIGGLLLLLIATRMIPKSEFGFITYANTSLTFIIPFIGFGIHQGLIRYGALSQSQLTKKHLFAITLKKGIGLSVLLLVMFWLFIPLITSKVTQSRTYLIILSFQLLSLFLYEITRIYSRLLHLNTLFSKISMSKTALNVLFAVILTWQFSGIGYAISLSIIPFLVAVFFIIKLRLVTKEDANYKADFDLKKFLSYGMFSAVSGVLSQLLYAIDILLIGNILIDETAIAQYKVSNILPFSFLFLSLVFIQTNFVKIAHKSKNDKDYIKHYYLNYLKFFSVVSLLIVGFFYLFSDYLILIFGKQYNNELGLMQIFAFGTAGALLFRIPLGNILSAIGWPKINSINALVILFLNLILSYIYIQKYGVIGAAYVTASLMWVSGLLSLIAFVIFLKRR